MAENNSPGDAGSDQVAPNAKGLVEADKKKTAAPGEKNSSTVATVAKKPDAKGEPKLEGEEGTKEPLALTPEEAYRESRKKYFANRILEMKERELAREARLGRPMPSVEGQEGLAAWPPPASSSSFSSPQQGDRLLQVLYSALLFIGLPVLISIIYFGFIASDQYASTAQFAVRFNTPPSSGGSGSSGLGGMLGGSSGAAAAMATLSDMYIVQQYINSPQLLHDIKTAPDQIDVRAMFSRPQADYWARLHNTTISDQQFIDYWKSMVQVQIDNTTGLGQLTVRAFTAEDAKIIADHVLMLSESLVNQLSGRAQTDSISLAQKEVDSAYNRVLAALQAQRAFLESTRDQEVAANLQDMRQSQLESTLVKNQTDLDSLRLSLPENSPKIKHLKEQIAIVTDQLAQEKAVVASNGKPPSEMLSTRDKLSLEHNFAEQAYASSLTTLENARLQALTKSRYLEAFVRPQLATYPEYPKRFQNVLLTFLAASLFWILGSLIVAATKEHL